MPASTSRRRSTNDRGRATLSLPRGAGFESSQPLARFQTEKSWSGSPRRAHYGVVATEQAFAGVRSKYVRDLH